MRFGATSICDGIFNMFRSGHHKTVLALIPGTKEQLKAENLSLRKSMRNMQMAQGGGARINVPECPVI